MNTYFYYLRYVCSVTLSELGLQIYVYIFFGDTGATGEIFKIQHDYKKMIVVSLNGQYIALLVFNYL